MDSTPHCIPLIHSQGRLSGTLPNEAIDPPKDAGYVMNVLHKSTRFPATLRACWDIIEELEAEVHSLTMHMRQPRGDNRKGGFVRDSKGLLCGLVDCVCLLFVLLCFRA